MIQYRAFLNTDPPALVDIWRSQPPLQGRMQELSVLALERHVLAKPYFDRHGLIVALDDGHPVGFVHAGFGPNRQRTGIAYEQGSICMLVVRPHHQHEEIRRQLLSHGERYLREKGARQFWGGAKTPLAPFYLGLYGGSELPGLLVGDVQNVELFRQAGYQVVQHVGILERHLGDFRPPIDRVQLQHRRQYQVTPLVNPPSPSWWDACSYGMTDRVRFSLEPKTGGEPLGWVVLWDMEPLASSWNAHAMGIVHLQIDPARCHQGLGTFLMGEALRHAQLSGAQRVQVQFDQTNQAAGRLFAKLGFQIVDEGLVLRKAETSLS